MSQEAPSTDDTEVEEIANVRIRFAGDSGDGMQLVGARFTEASAIFGNDLSTFPSYPSEIRAPADTLVQRALEGRVEAWSGVLDRWV